MLPSCKQVAEQVSENIDEPLTGMRWLKVKMHLLMCAYCRRYNQQIKLSSQVVAELSQSQEVDQALQQNVEQCYRHLHGIDNKDS